MKAKLIKTNQEMFIHYHLKNENGHTIATTQFPFPSEVEYAADSRGITLQKLCYDNCQAIERGYDLDELAKTIFPDKIFTTNEEYEIPIDGFPYQWGFKVGFQKALELMGDKEFSEGDMLECWNKAHKKSNFWYEFIQSLQQTEWDVEIEMETVESYKDKMGNVRTEKTFPILDAEGCLMLKKSE